VFINPVGTGYSAAVTPFFQTERDLQDMPLVDAAMDAAVADRAAVARIRTLQVRHASLLRSDK
jgi:hypothetical protein